MSNTDIVGRYAKLFVARETLTNAGLPVPDVLNRQIAEIEAQASRNLDHHQFQVALEHAQHAIVNERQARDQRAEAHHVATREFGFRQLGAQSEAHHVAALRGEKIVREKPSRLPSDERVRQATSVIKEGGMTRKEYVEFMDRLAESRDLDKDLAQYGETTRAAIKLAVKDWRDGAGIEAGLAERREARDATIGKPEVVYEPDERDQRRATIRQAIIDAPPEEHGALEDLMRPIEYEDERRAQLAAAFDAHQEN